MSRWVSYGFAPRNDPETLQARQAETQLFREQLPLVLANADRILETYRYFYCRVDGAFLSAIWFSGGGSIPLGALLLLWRRGLLIFECPECRGRFHAVGMCGSILSGSGSVWGPCLDCGKQQYLRTDGLGKTIAQIDSLLKACRTESVIRNGKQPRFDWKDGLVGESTPDVALIPAIEPAPLNVLIAELGGPAVEAGPAAPPTPPPDPPRRGVGPLNLQKKRSS